MQLKTKRLILREVKDSDLDNLVKDMNNIKISSCLLGVPHPFTKKDGKSWIKYCLHTQKENPRTEFVLAITLKDDKKSEMIGEVIISEIEHDQKTANLVYWLSEFHWRKGLIEEALKEVIKFAFEKLDLRRIEISAFAKNIASNNLAKKMGFNYEGTKRQACVPESTGEIHDDNYYSLLDTEYHQNLK